LPVYRRINLPGITADPKDYSALLSGKTLVDGVGAGGMVEIQAGDAHSCFSDGVALRFH